MASSPSFVHLHCHTHYSLLDGAIQIPDLLDRCVEYDMPGCAMTDNGVMFGAIEFYLKAKARNLNPIIGCEMFLANDISLRERGWNRLILLCQNYEGYQNLIELVTISNLKGFYYKPRIDIDHLSRYGKGLVAISPGMRGPVAASLRSRNKDAATEFAVQLKEIYQERFFLGIQALDMPFEDMLREESIELGRELSIPIVATNDVYYLQEDRAFLRNILNCIQMGKKVEDDTRFRTQGQEQYFKTSEQMIAAFKDYPEAIANTVAIAKSCKLEIETEQVKLPYFECPNNQTSEEYLQTLVDEGIQKKYGGVTDELQARVRFEMNIINKMNYAPYFLIIHDFLNFAKSNGIPCGPGRGSAAGSIVAYALDITQIDPIQYNLLFERFLNPERVSMPDIDLDFCIRRRNEVIDYIVQKYGADHVAQIITFGTMNARGVIRDVGRVLNVPLSDVDRIAKLIPAHPGTQTSIEQALTMVPELKKLYDGSEEIKQLLDIGSSLEGFARHTSTHAAGVVISRDPLSKVVPLVTNEGQSATQYPMNDLEKIGLLKMDILGLRNLTVIDDAEKLIRNATGKPFSVAKLPVDDPATYQLLCEGHTSGVFQLESRGMRTLIKDLAPTVFEDIIALLALYRPGPLGSGMVSEFISNKSGQTQVKYELTQLEPILKETYGLIVYQEQVMQIASTIGGFSLGQSDMLRRAMGKKKKEEMDRLRDEFLQGAAENEVPKATAGKIFDLCYKFAEYGFNKSHSAAYALISYHTAYLKANYPREYLTALLSSVLGTSDKTSLYIQECRRMNINVLPPDVNHSQADFSIEGDDIRFGLKAIKNVGEGAIESIVQNREENGPYTSIEDFCVRVDMKQVNKRVIESLVKCGAMDSLGPREVLMGSYEGSVESAQIMLKERSNGQIGLFGDVSLSPSLPAHEDFEVPYLSVQDKLRMEKELLGLYISGHPLDPIRDMLEKYTHNSESLTAELEGQSIVVAGLLTNCRRIITKTKREMVSAILEDLVGEIPVILFQNKSFEKLAPFFIDDQTVYLKGRVKAGQDEISLMCEDIGIIDSTQHAKSLHIDVEGLGDRDVLSDIKLLCRQFKGNIPLYFHVGAQKVLSHKKFWISQDAQLSLEQLVGSGHIWMSS